MIILNEETRHFIRAHRTDDVRQLALRAHKASGVDVQAALIQIAGWQTAVRKLPLWSETNGIIYPPHLSLEQCSSEVTARYKAALLAKLRRRQRLVDLTGGMGVDCSFLSEQFEQTVYVERQASLCELAEANFRALGRTNITVTHADADSYLTDMPQADCLFIDPARRDGYGGKVISIADCEPNILTLKPRLLSKATQVLVKLSPMLDLTASLQQLACVEEAHIVAVDNECKELLLLLGHEAPSPNQVPVYCVNLSSSTSPAVSGTPFAFTRQEEHETPCHFTDNIGNYLYEPHAALLKGGAFRSVAHIYKVKKLHPNSHLYTSESFVQGFPGRSFRVETVLHPGGKETKAQLHRLGKANITVRNYPETVARLRTLHKLADGGDTYLFATTLNNGERVYVVCKKQLY
jgi:16S rRNA G966 N2-methylase RsmD